MITDIVAILYPDFETLDIFGPVEVFGLLPESFRISFYSPAGGVITSCQQVPVVTKPLASLDCDPFILIIPGGQGIEPLFSDELYIRSLKGLSEKASYILTVCTGSLLLAKTGLLNGKQATSNKRRFFITQKFPGVTWIKKARWVKDGSIYTSSGISAGIDMALGFLSDRCGHETAANVCQIMEYTWQEEQEDDPFSELYPD